VARHRLARPFIVVVRWFIELFVIFINFRFSCNIIENLEYISGLFSKTK
jgi:hypothetical protein